MYSTILFADGSDDLVPKETIEAQKERYCVERRRNCLSRVEKFKGLEVYFADGFGLEGCDEGQLGFEGWRVGEQAWRYVDLRVCTEENDSWSSVGIVLRDWRDGLAYLSTPCRPCQALLTVSL